MPARLSALLCAVVLLVCGSAAVVRAGSNLLLNPGFETGDFTDYATSGDFLAGAGVDCTSGYAHTGKCAAVLGGFIGDASLSQTVHVKDGHYYTFSFWMNGGAVGDGEIAATAQFTGGQQVTLVSSPGSSGYVQYVGLLASPAKGNVDLTVTIAAGGFAFDFYVDDLSLTMGGSVSGDPVFKGFLGQQFFVKGEHGQVMNLLSTFNMQLNVRYVKLGEGDSIVASEQRRVRAASVARHMLEPSVRAFPGTAAWSHTGNYIGEAGVALHDDTRVYVQSGSYTDGFATVTLNGRPLSVSNELLVLGQGANTTYVQRVSAHELLIRTVNVEFTLVNSDRFLNLVNIHLEKGFSQHSTFDGVLGHTTEHGWRWSEQAEQQAVIATNNLFERTASQE